MSATAIRPQGRVRASDPRHLMRFLKAQAGMTPEDIAKSERVSVATVKASIDQIESYRGRNTSLEFDLAMRDLVISAVPQAKETLAGLLAATELVEVTNDKTGKKSVQKVEDKTTRLEALRVVKDLMSSLQPKVPLVQQNTNTQINNLPSTTVTTGETTEERMARIRLRAKEYNALPPAVAAVPDHIDSGDDPMDGDYDEDDDDEEEEDEEED